MKAANDLMGLNSSSWSLAAGTVTSTMFIRKRGSVLITRCLHHYLPYFILFYFFQREVPWGATLSLTRIYRKITRGNPGDFSFALAPTSIPLLYHLISVQPRSILQGVGGVAAADACSQCCHSICSLLFTAATFNDCCGTPGALVSREMDVEHYTACSIGAPRNVVPYPCAERKAKRVKTSTDSVISLQRMSPFDE